MLGESWDMSSALAWLVSLAASLTTLSLHIAVICGALIAKKISVRMVTLIGALVFIGFAIASLFIDPYEENHLVPDVEVI